MIATLGFRLSDKHAKDLNRQSRAVNDVWNYCNDTQVTAIRRGALWPSGYELDRLTRGTSRDLDIHAHTIKNTCLRYAVSRDLSRGRRLRYRNGKSLGWVPFGGGHVKFDGSHFLFRGVKYKPLHLRSDIAPDTKIKAGSFNSDSRGRWYINIPIEVDCSTIAPKSEIGIDLGLKSLATLSDGSEIEMPSFYRKSEVKISTAQRARKPKRVKAIHAKVKNRRKDFLHKQSTKIAKENGLIVVGDVSPSKLAKTKFAKSVYDAGWSDFKRMLAYKSIMNGGTYLEVSEAYTTQTCSECGAMPASRPKGIAGLRIREWTCSCGAIHDRDVNAARNILRLGQQTLAGGAQ